MPLKLSNNAIGTLVSALTASSTSVVLAPGQGSRFPALSSGDWFPITVVRSSDPTVFEIMHVTARGGDVLTVVRGQEGTTAITFSVGDMVEHRLTSGALDRDFVRVGAGGLDNVKFSVTSDGDNLKATVQAGEKQEQLVRQKDLGTAASRDVTTSNTDNNAGRILRVGDFGIGGFAVSASGDWNDVNVTGIYMGSSMLNSPPWGGWAFVHCYQHNGIYTTQVAFDFTGTGSSRMAIRKKADGVWSNWVEVYHSGNLPSVTWNSLTGKPSTFPPSSHTHPWSQITGTPSVFPSNWANVAGKPTTFTPPTTHGAVGTYAFVTPRTWGPTLQTWGGTVAGSNLTISGVEVYMTSGGAAAEAIRVVSNPAADSGTALSGTWRIMGSRAEKADQRSDARRAATLAVRIS